MKTLLLLRHAKSSWKESELDDHDRPLNKRGKRDAPRMGRLLREEDLLPDLIVASSARRCRKTADHVIQASGYRGEARITGTLYEANGDRLQQLLSDIPNEVQRLLLVAHNPGMEELLERLIGAYAPLTTAALAHVELSIESWRELQFGASARLIRVWQPRELEP